MLPVPLALLLPPPMPLTLVLAPELALFLLPSEQLKLEVFLALLPVRLPAPPASLLLLLLDRRFFDEPIEVLDGETEALPPPVLLAATETAPEEGDLLLLASR